MRRSVYLARMLLALISAAIGVPNQAVYAMEGGKTAYANGLLTEFGALVPKPGQINLDTYSLGLDMYKNVGANGQKLGGGFDASGNGDAFRFLYTWKVNLYGFHLSTAITPVFETVNLRIAGVKSSSTGINQLFLEPVDITRDFGSLHALLSEHLYVPVGQHNTDNPASVNAGYLAANTQLAFTWIPTPRWDVTSWSSFGTQNARQSHALSVGQLR